MSFFVHESLYRSLETMERLRAQQVTICGVGAIGANLADTLARCGVGRLRLIDRDRVDARNLSTQPWTRTDVGAAKASLLANTLYRALKVEVEGQVADLTDRNVDKLLHKSALVVDAFDNSTSRALVKEACLRLDLPCLHVGLAPEYAEVVWNDTYRVPSDVNDDVCDYPLARNLVMMAVAVAAETIVRCVATGRRDSWTITIGDLAVRPC